MKTEPKGFCGRLPVAKGPPKTKPLKLRLEFAFEIQLEAAAGVGRGGETKIGTHDTDEGHIVRMIQDIENIESCGEYGTVFFLFLEMEIVSNVDVKIQKTRPVQRIARRQSAIRPVVENTVAVRIESCDYVDRLAGIRLKRNAETEKA